MRIDHPPPCTTWLVECYFWVKARKKEPNNVWTILKNCFLKIWKITMGTLYVKNKNKNWNKFLYFQSCNYKIFMKIHHVSKVLLYVQNTQEKHVDKFFLYQKSFSLIKCSPNYFNFFVNFNIFHKKGSMCWKHYIYIYIYIPF
jgi:hypothetical protein